MQIEFQNCQIDLADTKIEYNSSIRGDVRTISTILFLANWMGYSLDLVVLWDGIDRALVAVREMGDRIREAVEEARRG